MSSSGEEKKPIKKPFYQDVDGFLLPGFFSAEAYRSVLTYKPRPDDLFIVTYPKCGTTWTQNIVACIFREGKPFTSALQFFTETPFLEMTGAKAGEVLKRPGAMKLHLPFRLTPWSPEAKYIYVARNPKDCFVSMYYHTEGMPGYRFEDGSLDDFFELFIKGEVEFGDYFETILSWWEHRNDPNVLFITYEQLKKDTRGYVLKIAEFIDPKYREKLEKDEKMLQDVIHHSSFAFMKEHLNRHLTELMAMPRDMVEQNPDIPQGLRTMMLSGNFQMKKKDEERVNFVRKGIVGDWKNHLSPEQNARLEKRFREKFAGTGLLELWKDNIVSSLAAMPPEREGKCPSKMPWYQEVDGWRIPGLFSPDAFRSALSYKPRPGDLFIVTFPKCGTTWLQNIVACIFRDGRPFESALQFFTETPFLEMTGAKAGEDLKRPGAIKMHLPFYKTPWSTEAKYIYIARNPKDCCVSFYHFTESTPTYRFEGGKFDDFFELFINGETDFGDYFDTTLSWYERRNEPNVFFITYEQLKKDSKSYVLKTAEFLGTEYKERLEKDEKMLQDVMHHSSFDFMKEHLNRHFTELMAIPREVLELNPDIPSGLRMMLLSGNFQMKKKDAEGVSFIRKGIIGDWRNHLSPSQNARLEKKFRERFAGTGLLDLWKDDM